MIPSAPSLDRLCVHTMTTKPLSLEQAAPAYAKRGISGITVWRDSMMAAGGPLKSRQIINDNGLAIVSLCRGGFFTYATAAEKQKAIDDNLLAIDEAALLGAPMVVLVCGARPGQSMETSRSQIAEGIAAIEPYARACGVKLAIEPLHPMYAADRSAINTLCQANDLCATLSSPFVGVALDVYHTWWDPALASEIARCGTSGWLMAFHVCDWLIPTTDLLLDRGLMGEGCIPIPEIRRLVEATGFRGFIEVEIFSNRWWAEDQSKFLDAIVSAYKTHC